MDGKKDDAIYSKPMGGPIIIYPPSLQKFSKSPYKKWVNKSLPWSQKKMVKYKYHSKDGKRLAAGGILFFEETTRGKGLWLIEEEENGETIYTDFGGKYDHNDGDIFATISREFREECYNTAEVSYNDIKNIPEDHHVYIDGYDGKPVYLCVICHINQFGIQFDSAEIKRKRREIIDTNPNVPEKWYRTLDVKFVLLRDIKNGKSQLSNRAGAILRNLVENKDQCNPELVAFFNGFDFHQKN